MAVEGGGAGLGHRTDGCGESPGLMEPVGGVDGGDVAAGGAGDRRGAGRVEHALFGGPPGEGGEAKRLRGHWRCASQISTVEGARQAHYVGRRLMVRIGHDG